MDAAFPATPTDPWAIDGKFGAPEEHADLLVVGAGPAGLAAATEAARLGVHVVLVDENPVPLSLMGIDVPLFYGQHMNAAVQDAARMVERLVAATPAMEAAYDAGVDLRLGVTAWGAFANGPALQALPARVVGLTDGKRSWMCGFGALVLARKACTACSPATTRSRASASSSWVPATSPWPPRWPPWTADWTWPRWWKCCRTRRPTRLRLTRAASRC